MTPQGRKRAQQAPNGRHGGSLGYSLRQAVKHFNKAVGSLESDILGTTRQLKDLGAAGGSKDIPTVPSTHPPSGAMALFGATWSRKITMNRPERMVIWNKHKNIKVDPGLKITQVNDPGPI